MNIKETIENTEAVLENITAVKGEKYTTLVRFVASQTIIMQLLPDMDREKLQMVTTLMSFMGGAMADALGFEDLFSNKEKSEELIRNVEALRAAGDIN